MVLEGKPIVALCGPSGVGKEYLKDKIKDRVRQMPFSEPVVATTRPTRNIERDSRISGLSEDGFLNDVLLGRIVLAHRPFRDGSTNLYGFMAASFIGQHYQLTEVHSLIIERFKQLLSTRPVLIIGLVATRETLELNLSARQAVSKSEDEIETRLDLATREVGEITDAYQCGLINVVVDLNPPVRSPNIQEIVHITEAFYAES